MTADHKHDSKAEHDAVIKAEKDAEAEYQAGLKKDKAAEPKVAEVPYVRPLERPHYSLTEECKKWDESVAAELAAAQPVTKIDPRPIGYVEEDEEESEDKPKAKGKK
jgi:hypothetical protein